MQKKFDQGPTALVILDGFGYRKEKDGNAVACAKMPNWRGFISRYPSILLKASGRAVGLLPDFIGNSEVGHTTLGCGRVVETVLTRIHESIKNGSFFKNQTLIKNFGLLKKKNAALHIIGLLSDAGVHSHEFHLDAIIKLARIIGLKKIFIHPILDGRDTRPRTALIYLKRLQKLCEKVGCVRIASLHGRFYAMDRDYNWDRIKKSYDVLCNKGKIESKYKNWQEVLDAFFKNNASEEFLTPTLLLKEGQIKLDDGIVFFNFRPDRARLLTRCFIDPNFSEFKVAPLNSTVGTLSFFITPVRFDKEFKKFKNEVLFENQLVKNTLLDEIFKQVGKKVFVIAETEKYAHVTYFFRGLVEKQLSNEEYHMVPSLKLKSYADYPEMSAQQITEQILKSLRKDPAYFYLVNYANPDMVGHSGNFDATVKACEFLDDQIRQLYKEVVEKKRGNLFIVSDHGKAEEMKYEKTGEPRTSHTTNPVVFLKITNENGLIKQDQKKYAFPKFGLSVVAPTILKTLGLQIPKDMEQVTVLDD